MGADNTLHNMQENSSQQGNHTTIDMGATKRKTGTELLKNQIFAMIIKRALSTIRSWQLLVVQFLIPVVLLILAIISGQQSATKELPSLDIELASYRDPVTLINCDEEEMCNAGAKWLNDQSLELKKVKNVSQEVLAIASVEPGTFRSSYIIGADFLPPISAGDVNSPEPKRLIRGWFNNEAYHTPPLVVNFVYNAIVKLIDPDCEISVANYPLPLTANSMVSFLYAIYLMLIDVCFQFQLLQQGNNLGFQMAINIGFCMSFISAFYILFYVRERVCKAKHLQFVSGVNVFTFWAVSYLWDWCTYIITIIILVVTLICFQEEGFKEGESIGNDIKWLLLKLVM